MSKRVRKPPMTPATRPATAPPEETSQLARLEAYDPEFRTGAVELDEGLPGEVQILPVWASSEPFGYGGGNADSQVVGGDEAGAPATSAACARAEREVIGPEAG